jgi:hypothetical protein
MRRYDWSATNVHMTFFNRVLICFVILQDDVGNICDAYGRHLAYVVSLSFVDCLLHG